MEAHLDSLENKIDELLVKAEQEQKSIMATNHSNSTTTDKSDARAT
ncbi:MAG TPA: hypothetical protein VHV10_13420 [Ktedonobacteraceae bacterium]|jgi:hypothetical protein|nr:hypothetical protein [Ktedonobacteraceae bacterium]